MSWAWDLPAGFGSSQLFCPPADSAVGKQAALMFLQIIRKSEGDFKGIIQEDKIGIWEAIKNLSFFPLEPILACIALP